MTTAHEDDGFHEIQLSGKQLVFLFMATTVVSVVIFLCGVLVGRGVRAERAEVTEPPADLVAAAESGAPPAAEPAQPAPAEATPDELSYHKRLEGEGTPAETLKPAPQPSAGEPSRPAEPAPAPAPAATPPAAREGFFVQLAALRDRNEAGALVKRLEAKGYPAYLVDPAAGTPTPVYRVRVGTYGNRREAEQIARRLEREEQFKPFISR
jgi:cell division septation protein DedD